MFAQNPLPFVEHYVEALETELKQLTVSPTTPQSHSKTLAQILSYGYPLDPSDLLVKIRTSRAWWIPSQRTVMDVLVVKNTLGMVTGHQCSMSLASLQH